MTLNLYWPIAKLDSDARLVYGYASTEARDSQGEIVRKEAIEAALPAYMRFANIREMHRASAVGVAQEAAVDDRGLWLKAKIVDDDAWRKVKEGVYKGFSIGGQVVARDERDPRIVTGVDLTEISLVDRPANPEAVLSLWKNDGLAKSTFTEAAEPTDGLTNYALEGAEPERSNFADPGYQADGQKRYPLDTPERVRAAWSYIHQAKNRAPYTQEQLAHIEARILAAWRAKIDPKGPHSAAAAEKRDESDADAVQAIHDHAVAMGARCHDGGAAEKIAGAALLKMAARQEALEARLAQALPLLDEVKALIEKMAAQPAVTPPARLVAVEKGADVARELERMAEQPPALTALELIKRAIREPLPFGARPER